MKLSINLLQESQKLRARLKGIGLILQTISVVVLIVFGVGVFALLSYTVFINSQQKNISEKITEEKKVIESLRPVEAKQFLIKRKLMYIARTIDEHGVRHELVTDFYEFAHPLITVKQMSISGKSRVLLLNAEAKDVFALVSFLDKLTDFSEANSISKGLASGFSRDIDGVYMFSLNLFFEEK